MTIIATKPADDTEALSLKQPPLTELQVEKKKKGIN